MRYLLISIASLFAAYADFSDIVETVFVTGTNGEPLRINKSDYSPEKHGELLPDPHAGPVNVTSAAPVLTNLQQSANLGAAAGDQKPVDPLSGYCDPAFRPYYVAQIGQRWFLTDDKGRKFQKGQSAVGFDTQELANAKAAELTAAEKA